MGNCIKCFTKIKVHRVHCIPFPCEFSCVVARQSWKLSVQDSGQGEEVALCPGFSILQISFPFFSVFIYSATCSRLCIPDSLQPMVTFLLQKGKPLGLSFYSCHIHGHIPCEFSCWSKQAQSSCSLVIVKWIG